MMGINSSDRRREVFQRDFGGELREVDTSSDADEILAQLLHEPNEMRFRLTYDGELKASGSNRRASEKWEIRKHLNPQLAELWEVHPTLHGDAFGYTMRVGIDGAGSGKERLAAALREPLVLPWTGHKFIPLVRNDFKLTCSLDILFLRKQPPGSLVSRGGDLDNRIKLLFDGLRVPHKDEMACGSPDTDPFYCLLENDDLITDFSVRTDRLLTRPGAPASEVRLIIDVVVRPSSFKPRNSGFMSD